MKSFKIALLLALTISSGPSIAIAAPVIPGLSNKHPLTEPQVGRLLISELRCIACHHEPDSSQSLERPAPDLSDVGARVSPKYLQRFIASPTTAHAGTTMPDLLHGKSATQREKISEAMTHFLIAQSRRKFEPRAVEKKTAAQGKALFHSIGCAVCHSPRNEQGKEIIRDGAVRLEHVPEKYSRQSLTDFLFQPTRVRPSGRMPDMKLTPDEAKAIAGYLLGTAKKKVTLLEPNGKLAAVGKQHFQDLNCTACHKLSGMPTAKPVAALKNADVAKGCLSAKPGKAPQFHLSAEQTKAIRAALAKKAGSMTDRERLATTMTTFNCIGCHVRDEYGGVAKDRDRYFGSSEKELGDDGRIPPPLTLVGAKLKKVAMKKVLFDGDAVRHYMATRMPRFGESNLRHLPELLAGLDKVKKINFSLPSLGRKTQKEREREKEMRAAGRELVGDKGLTCIACHSFNGMTASRQGIDLLTFNERLQPSWFYRFVRDPNAFRPRTVMPTAWPDGQALHRTILNGDTDRQIEAIWYYLSLGTSARDPSGVRVPRTLLKVTDIARVQRGRSTVAGYRGIAVGFPNQLNYAFNAETGTLSAIWKGDFITVNRRGQGSGQFNPAARFIALAQDLSFHRLANNNEAWPLRPVMTKEAPVNPNPLYPRKHGYQFKGYYLDNKSVPTFMYRSGSIQIEDRSSSEVVDKKLQLVRKWSFDSPKEQTVWFRALTGEIQTERNGVLKTSRLRLTIPSVPTVLRKTASDPNKSELLLKLTIPKGKSTQKLIYEILP